MYNFHFKYAIKNINFCTKACKKIHKRNRIFRKSTKSKESTGSSSMVSLVGLEKYKPKLARDELRYK